MAVAATLKGRTTCEYLFVYRRAYMPSPFRDYYPWRGSDSFHRCPCAGICSRWGRPLPKCPDNWSHLLLKNSIEIFINYNLQKNPHLLKQTADYSVRAHPHPHARHGATLLKLWSSYLEPRGSNGSPQSVKCERFGGEILTQPTGCFQIRRFRRVSFRSRSVKKEPLLRELSLKRTPLTRSRSGLLTLEGLRYKTFKNTYIIARTSQSIYHIYT